MSNLSNFDYDSVASGVLRLVKDKALLEKFWKEINPEFFFYGDKSLKVRGFRKIIEMILDRCKKNDWENISVEQIDSLLHQTVDSEENNEAKNQFRWLMSDDSILRKANDPGCFVIFMDFLKATVIIEWSMDFTKDYKNGEIGRAVESMKDVLPRIDSFKEEKVETLDFTDIEKCVQEEEKSLEKVLYMGNKQMDANLGGFEKQTLTLFITVTNGGKSMMAHHLLRRCVTQGIPVHITCVEDRPKSFARRILAAVTGIEVNKIKNIGTLSTEEKLKIEEAKIRLAKYVKVEFMYGESISAIHKRKLECDEERVARGLEPYLVDIVDYTAHVAAFSRGDKKYEQVHTAYAERKNFCLKYGKIGFDFAQINREGNHKNNDSSRLLTHADLAASYDLSQVCDTIISINRSEAQRKQNLATLNICKGRDSIAGETYEVQTQFNMARWGMEITVMNDNIIGISNEGSGLPSVSGTL